ncbi:adenosine deaminase CECR1-A [Staphylotrichum tortipilum]|uniref:Adenosine deaminase CECR1-A n=1 Tax=Staphylotrichum tortipilum TaxID=2831512 RepID=A0AAN6RTM9_9PEZI|nr:adenosine deaminase CECR1-A [Staphylotrichum longicolle]
MAPITDDDWADLVAHELPKTDDPVVQKYLESRRALMAEEGKHRSADHAFRQALSPIAKQACAILSRIRHEERLAGASTNTVNTKETAKSWHIIYRLPKGTLLRAHCHALVDLDFLIETALATPGMHLCSPANQLVTAEERREAKLRIRFRSKANFHASSPWTPDYKPGAFVPLTAAADAFPEGGREGFIAWLGGRCSMDALKLVSELVDGMIYYEPIWRAFLQCLMANLADEGVRWLELRLSSRLVYYREGSETPDPDHDHVCHAIDEEAAKFKATNRGEVFWGLRIIWPSICGGQDPRSIIEDADDCIATKLAWPHLVAGYDIRSSESPSGTLATRLPELFWFRKQCALEGITIPFFFHAADCPGGDGLADDDNLFDALLLGARRIANAPSLPQHPRLIEAIKDKRILVEGTSCVTPGGNACSPLPELLARGVSCVLSDDKFGILSVGASSRMTDVFWHAFQTWSTADLATLGSMAENSVRWAAFEDQDAETWVRDIRAASMGGGVKAARLQQWAVEWERFCLWVVTEHGDTYGDGMDGEPEPLATAG